MADLTEGFLAQGIDDRGQILFLLNQSGVPSVANIAVGDILYLIDGEGARVQSVNTVNNSVTVTRGEFGQAYNHAALMPFLSGNGNRFYTVDPVGLPAPLPINNPWVNLTGRRVWRAQGDQTGPGSLAIAHAWVQQTISYVVGALGIRQLVVTPNSTP